MNQRRSGPRRTFLGSKGRVAAFYRSGPDRLELTPFWGGFGGGGQVSRARSRCYSEHGMGTARTTTPPGERGEGPPYFPTVVVFLGGGNLGLHMYPFYLVHEGPHLMLASRRVRLHGTWYAGERKAPNFSSARTLARRLSYSLRYLFFCIVQYLRVQSR